MTARNQPPAKVEAPLENIKPRRGMLVNLAEAPGVWQVTDQAPGVPGSWWLTPWDEAACQAPPDREWGSYRKATYRTMRSANARS